MSTRLETFQNIINGQGEGYLTAAWKHFVGEEYDRARFVKAHVDFVQQWDWDWVKINPRANYYAETWGASYDPTNYDIMVPTLVEAAITKPSDLSKIVPLKAQDNPILREEIARAREIKQAFPDRAVIQSVFSPLGVLLFLADIHPFPPGPGREANGPVSLTDLLDTDRALTLKALEAITETLKDYVIELLKPVEEGGAGLDGIFYAVLGLPSKSFIPKDKFDQLSTPFDLGVLEAAKGSAVVFHTCSMDSHPDWFTQWPLSALQWDQFLDGNPDITTDLGVIPVGGPEARLFEEGQDLDLLQEQLARTLEQRQGKPFLLASSCSLPLHTSDEALEILSKA
ncbi:MAG: hypothetical protein LBG99_05335 [Propionibacteriaceae bacterium]|jgi:uroporphyrinogen decarboxylase|nr:hypothetical protein [Propionibacteriaceae bacterium]